MTSHAKRCWSSYWASQWKPRTSHNIKTWGSWTYRALPSIRTASGIAAVECLFLKWLQKVRLCYGRNPRGTNFRDKTTDLSLYLLVCLVSFMFIFWVWSSEKKSHCKQQHKIFLNGLYRPLWSPKLCTSYQVSSSVLATVHLLLKAKIT